MRLHRNSAIIATVLGLIVWGCIAKPQATHSIATKIPSVQDDIPTRERCKVMTFMVYNASWWIQVRRDGQHSIGFGALPQRVVVNSDAFNFEQVYDSVVPHVHQQQTGLLGQEIYEESYRFEAMFSTLDQNDTSFAYLLEEAVNPYMTNLFRKAYHNRDSARTIIASHYSVIQRFWNNAPFLSDE